MSNSEICSIKVNGSSAPETKINLTTIKRSDQYVHHIISTTSHVEVYKFDSSTRIWERTTTEGSLFIYNRAETPAFGFVVLNRLNSGNILEYVVPGMEFKIQDSFIMYRSSDDAYCGLHFDDSSECNRVGDILISISTGTDAADQDVVQLLEKAFHQSAEGSSIAEQKQKAIELGKDSQQHSSGPNATASPRKSSSKQQRPSKSTKKESRETQSSSKGNTRLQEIPAKANSERVPTKHVSRADGEEFQDLKRQLFKSPERTKSKKIPSSTENKLSVGTTMLSSSLPHTMLSLAEVEKKLHSSVTTANSSSIRSSSIGIRPRSGETVLQSQLIEPSSFAVPAASTSLPNSKSAARLTKAASLDIKSLSHSFSQPMIVDESTLQAPSHFPPVPPIMVSPGMRSAPVSSSSDQGLIMKPIPSASPAAVQPTVMHAKQQPPTTTVAAEPLPPSSYQTPNRQANVESGGKELPVPKAQNGSQNSALSPMVTAHHANKPVPMLNREQFIQAMVYMIKNDTDFSDRLYQAYQHCLLDNLQ